MSEEEMTRFYITVSSPKEYRLTRYKGVHFEDPNHKVNKELTTSLDLNLLTQKLNELKKQKEFEELDQMVNKHKLKEIKLKITKDSVLETTPHSIKRDISAKNFFISKRTFIGGGDSSTKSSQTLDSSGLFFKNISASKKSLLYSDHTKSTQRLNKSTVSTVHSEALSTANKDSGRGIEIAKITKVKPQDNKKPTSAYKNLFSSLVERTNDCRAYKILSPKKVHF